MTDTAPSSKKLDALTPFRFVAAAMIVLLHSMKEIDVTSEDIGGIPLGQAVSFFFILSGFILAYVYPSLSQISNVKDFLAARFARIFPVHIFTFFLTLILLPVSLWSFSGDASWDSAILNLFLVQAWVPLWHYYASFNSPTWALSAEWFLYLCFPFLIWRWNKTWFIKLILILSLLSAMLFIANRMHIPNVTAGYSGITTHALFYINPLSRLVEFALGMVMALIRQKVYHRITFGQLIGTSLECCTLGLVWLSLHFYPQLLAVPSHYNLPILTTTAGMSYLSTTSSTPFFALLIFMISLEKGLISKLLSYRIPVLLGEISFSIYMLHGILLLYYHVKSPLFAWMPVWVSYSLLLIVMLLTSHLMWLFIEQPSRRVLLTLWRKRKNSASGQSVPASSSYSTPAVAPKLSVREKPAYVYAEVLTVVLAFTLLSFNFGNSNSSIHVIRIAEANKLAAQSQQPILGANFGDKFILRALKTEFTKKGLTIDFAWESVIRQTLVYRNAVHLVDAQGVILNQADFPQDNANGEVVAGTLWHNSITIPNDKLKGMKAVALAIYLTPAELLPIDRGPRDWGDRRLIVSIDERS